MGINFNLEDLPPNLRKQAMKKLAAEDARKKKKNPLIFDGDASAELARIANDLGLEQPKKKSKYKAEKITTTLYDGTEYTFDSKKEYRRYQELEVMQLSGEISDLKLQVKFDLIPSQKLSTGKTERGIQYVADFCYTEDGKRIVEDVKGYRDGGAYRVFRIKKKLMKYFHNIEIKEV